MSVGSGSVQFYTNNASTYAVGTAVTPTERMRIDSIGTVLVGKTAADAGASEGFQFDGPNGLSYFTRDGGPTAVFRRNSNNGDAAVFRRFSTTVGSISVTASATAYNTSSDYRLKEAWVPMIGASERVQALKPINFAWKVDGSRVDGFLAHEAQAVVPECATGTKDAVKDEEYEVTAAVYEDIIVPAVEAVAEVPAVYDDAGALVSESIPAVEAEAERTEQNLVTEAVMGTRSVPDMQGIDQSKLVPLLTAALQEALTKIDALEARMAAQEAV